MNFHYQYTKYNEKSLNINSIFIILFFACQSHMHFDLDTSRIQRCSTYYSGGAYFNVDAHRCGAYCRMAFTCEAQRLSEKIQYSTKKPNRGRGVEDMEYPGILKKQHGISRGDQEKVMCNFQGSWFQVLLKISERFNTTWWSCQW